MEVWLWRREEAKVLGHNMRKVRREFKLLNTPPPFEICADETFVFEGKHFEKNSCFYFWEISLRSVVLRRFS